MKLNGNFKGRLHQYFMRKIGAFDYRHSWMKSDCPYCGGEKKFGINLSNNRCNCFKCGEHPSPISLVMYLESTDSFQEVLSILESGDYSGYVFKEEKVELKGKLISIEFLGYYILLLLLFNRNSRSFTFLY